MAYFDRCDICAAHLALEWDYHQGGWLQERPSNKRRMESTDVQLRRIGFKPGAAFSGFRSLSENAKEIYHELVFKLKLPVPDCCECEPGELHAPDCEHDCGVDYCANFEDHFFNEEN